MGAWGRGIGMGCVRERWHVEEGSRLQRMLARGGGVGRAGIATNNASRGKCEMLLAEYVDLPLKREAKPACGAAFRRVGSTDPRAGARRTSRASGGVTHVFHGDCVETADKSSAAWRRAADDPGLSSLCGLFSRPGS